MYTKIQDQLRNKINEIREAGLYKSERVIEKEQRDTAADSRMNPAEAVEEEVEIAET